MVPLAIYGLQAQLGYWDTSHTEYCDFHRYIDWRWLDDGTWHLLFGAILPGVTGCPSVMPLAVVLWYLSMDLTPSYSTMKITAGIAGNKSRWWSAY